MAAAKLRAIWDATPRKERPTQEEMAALIGGGSQSLTHQYLHAKIALNYKALMAFAEALKVDPETIRADLPEQQLARRLGLSQPMRDDVRRINSRREALGLSAYEVHQRLLKYSWPVGTSAPTLETVGDWFSGTQRPPDMRYTEALYKALDMEIEEATRSVPTAPQTALSQTILAKVERLPVGKQEALLAWLAQEGE
jgi:hypothetical protein